MNANYKIERNENGTFIKKIVKAKKVSYIYFDKKTKKVDTMERVYFDDITETIARTKEEFKNNGFKVIDVVKENTTKEYILDCNEIEFN